MLEAIRWSIYHLSINKPILIMDFVADIDPSELLENMEGAKKHPVLRCDSYIRSRNIEACLELVHVPESLWEFLTRSKEVIPIKEVLEGVIAFILHNTVYALRKVDFVITNKKMRGIVRSDASFFEMVFHFTPDASYNPEEIDRFMETVPTCKKRGREYHCFDDVRVIIEEQTGDPEPLVILTTKEVTSLIGGALSLLDRAQRTATWRIMQRLQQREQK